MKQPPARLAYFGLFTMVASYAVWTLSGSQGLGAFLERRQQIRELEQRNAGLAREVESMRDYVHRLEQNPDAQEWEIRERLKLVRPGEKVYVIERPAGK
jgi:cell division protein FtsB